jgi:hypothetical protein
LCPWRWKKVEMPDAGDDHLRRDAAKGRGWQGGMDRRDAREGPEVRERPRPFGPADMDGSFELSDKNERFIVVI